LEFDFGSQLNGLSFAARPGSPAADSIAEVVERFGRDSLPASALDEWRERTQKPFKMCKCCAKAAYERALDPKSHVMFRILEHCVENQHLLYAQLYGEHVSLTAWVRALKLQVAPGWIKCCDPSSEIPINAAFCHTLKLSKEKIDGQTFATADLYESHGNKLLRIATKDVHVFDIWKDLCQTDAYPDFPDFSD
ncbi:MAG: hypothetical protein AAF585_04225, partial [Verrucomicrobiota bacterium]